MASGDETFDQPFNPSSSSKSNETQTLDRIILDAIHGQLYDLHTWLPAQVIAVHGNQLVDIQPQIKRLYKDGTLVALPPIQNVMVAIPRGADYWIKLPIAVGDTGIALFCERSLDNWSVAGGTVDPQDIRKHDLSDAIFIPGIFPISAQTTDNTSDLIVHNGNAELRVQKSGRFKIKNQSQELIDLLDQLLTILTTETFTNTAMGPQPFIDATNQLLTDLQTKLETLKGT